LSVSETSSLSETWSTPSSRVTAKAERGGEKPEPELVVSEVSAFFEKGIYC